MGFDFFTFIFVVVLALLGVIAIVGISGWWGWGVLWEGGVIELVGHFFIRILYVKVSFIYYRLGL